jgi:hypothetical protein
MVIWGGEEERWRRRLVFLGAEEAAGALCGSGARRFGQRRKKATEPWWADLGRMGQLATGPATRPSWAGFS